MLYTQLKTQWTDWLTGDGIFSYIAKNTGYVNEWNNNPAIADIQYIARSGDKITSKLVDIMSNDTQPLTAQSKQLIANAAIQMYGETWNGLYKTCIAPDFDNDYKRTETYTGSTTGTGSHDTTRTDEHGHTITTTGNDKTTGSGGGTEKIDYGGTDKTTTNTTRDTIRNTTDTTIADRTAFDSGGDDYVHDTKTAVTHGGDDTETTDSTDTTTHTGADTHTTTNTNTNETTTNKTDTHGGTDKTTTADTTTDNTNTQHTRETSGRNRPQAELIAGARDALMFNFWQTVFSDVDNLLTIHVY